MVSTFRRADAIRHHRHATTADRARNATPLTRNNAEVDGLFARWWGMRARCTAPLTAISTAAICTVAGAARCHGLCCTANTAMGRATIPPIRPGRWPAARSYIAHQAWVGYLRGR